jgi:outer membrane receptor protein involved in Fe transport
MRARTFAALVVALLVALPAIAQEQRGAIEGVVKDSSGAVLPGVAVEARTNTGVVLSTITDADGRYRFPSLLPGTYEISASLQGFESKKQGDVPVNLGQVKKVDLALALAGVAETVAVTASSPLVDVTQSTRATAIRGDRVELLPHGRDFTTLVTQAPGANMETKSGNGIMIDGATAAENRYVVDGMETTDIVKGTSAKNVLVDFVDEVQVKSSGYPAEYGGSTGGVINVITKSGTNKFSGSALTYFQGSDTTAENNKSLRLTLTDSNVSEYVRYPEDDVKRFEPGGSLGGPVMANKAWFFGAYQPALTTTKRTVDAASSVNPAASSISRTQKQQIQYLTANETMQLGSRLRTRVAFNSSYVKTTGQLPSQNGTDNPSTNYEKGNRAPNWLVSGTADYSVSPKLLLSFKGGLFRQDSHDFNVPDAVKFTFASSNVGMAGVPASLQHGSNFTNVLSNNAITKDLQQRKFAQADATLYLGGAGSHQIKGGVQFDLRSEDINSGNLKQVLTLNWGQSTVDPNGNTVTGPFGYYQVTSNAASPRQGFITQGDVNSNVFGMFVQDKWSVNNHLTIDLGVRTETEKVPAYTNDPASNRIGKYPIEFGFGEKVAPRAGAAYDIKGDGQWKAYASWGIFYDIFKLDVGQGSFGGAKWIEWYFTMDNPNFESLNASENCPPACSGTFITKQDLRQTSLDPVSNSPVPYASGVQTDMKPMRSQEAAVGLERQLSAVTSLSVRYVHKQLDRGIEDTGAIDANTDDEPYIIGNPGEGPTQTFDLVGGRTVFTGTGGQYANPKPKRDYNGLEVAFDKRFARRWSAHVSYTLSRSYGNYPGLAESDEATGSAAGRVDPNVGRQFDYPIMQFGGDGKPLYGVLPTDRTHFLKLSAIYQLPFGTTVGFNEFVASGIPISRAIAVIAGHNYPVYYKGRGSDGRTPTFSQGDLYVQHEIRLPGGKAFQVNANVLNLFDQRIVANKFNNVRRAGTVIPIDEAAFYAGNVNIQALIDAAAFPNGAMRIDPRFLQASDFQAPLVARFGVKFTF